MQLPEILKDSFELLRDNPVMFTPKIISSLLGSLWFVGILFQYGSVWIYIVTAPLMVYIGFMVTVMLAYMVKNNEESSMLKNSLLKSLRLWRQISFSVILLLAGSIVVQLPFILGIYLFLVHQSLLAIILGGLLSFILILGGVFIVFFYPISMLTTSSVLTGLKGSALISRSHKKEVIGVTLLAFLLLGFAGITNTTLGQFLGFAGFIFFRLVSAVITTYIYVVSPSLYLEANS